MTLQQLEYVIALNKTRSFSKAAEECFVTQPTLSVQVNKLEDEAGIKIFDRSKKPMELTSQGIQFIDKAKKIVELANTLKSDVNTEKNDIKGKFRIGIIPTMAPYILPLLLHGFSNKYPDTKLVIEEMQSNFLIDYIKNDKLDIGILATPTNEKLIKEIPVFNESFLLYLPKDHELLNKTEVDPDDLDNEKLLTLSEGHCFRNQSLSICNVDLKKIDKKISYESGSLETLINLVDRGLGYSLIPELAVKSDLKRIRKFKKPAPTREVSIIVKNTFTKDALIEVIKDKISYSLPEQLLSKKAYKRIEWR